jgi:hypothetical protein
MLQRSGRAAGFIEPCLPSPAKAPLSGPKWIHEIKHDGFRILARRILGFSYGGCGSAIALASNIATVTIDVVAPPTTPLPATLPLFATGLGAVGLLGWRRKRKARGSLFGAV